MDFLEMDILPKQNLSTLQKLAYTDAAGFKELVISSKFILNVFFTKILPPKHYIYLDLKIIKKAPHLLPTNNIYREYMYALFHHCTILGKISCIY